MRVYLGALKGQRVGVTGHCGCELPGVDYGSWTPPSPFCEQVLHDRNSNYAPMVVHGGTLKSFPPIHFWVMRPT